MPPACSSAARIATANPPCAALPPSTGPTRLETTTRRRAVAAGDPTRGAIVAGGLPSPVSTTEPASPAIGTPLSPLVELRAGHPVPPSPWASARRNGLQPVQHLGNAGQVVESGGGTRRRANPDRHATAAIHRDEAVLVGGVVADKHGSAAAKRRLGEEGGDHRALVMVAGLELENHLAGDQPQGAAFLLNERLDCVADLGCFLRDCPVMQRQSPALVFEPGAGPSPLAFGNSRPQPVECRRGVPIGGAVAALDQAAVGAPALGAVQAGCGASPRLKQPVEFGERASADQRQSAVALPRQPFQQTVQLQRDAYQL